MQGKNLLNSFFIGKKCHCQSDGKHRKFLLIIWRLALRMEMRSYCTKYQAINVVVAQEEGRGTSVSWSEPVTPYIHIYMSSHINVRGFTEDYPPTLQTLRPSFRHDISVHPVVMRLFSCRYKATFYAKTEIPRLYDSKKKREKIFFFNQGGFTKPAELSILLNLLLRAI